MTENTQKIGFTYFSTPEFLINNQLETWLPGLKRLGTSYIIYEAGFDYSVPEDAFLIAEDNGLQPIVHLTSELPIARKFNEAAVLMDAYAKWGVKVIILGNKPNTKAAWLNAGWHYENLVDHFLDRFIPLANYAVQIGMSPVLPPMQPGGDYWDTAFIELVMAGLNRRKLDKVLEHLILSSYGYTFDQPLSWGKGGPECWSASKPYLTPEGQEDQLGFHNFEWVQAQANRVSGRRFSVFILNAGHPGTIDSSSGPQKVLENVQRIVLACRGALPEEASTEYPTFDSSIAGCIFNLDTLDKALEGNLNMETLAQLFGNRSSDNKKSITTEYEHKIINHYLLLPSYSSGVSDVILNKVKPVIKKYQPTIGFSLEEAVMAQKVTIYPDPLIFTDEHINQLRSAGCSVEILPESGIEIATSLQ